MYRAFARIPVRCAAGVHALSDVARQAFGFFVSADAAGALALDPLLVGLPLDRAALLSSEGRFTWDAFRVVCQRAAVAVGSDEALVALGPHVVNDAVVGLLARVAPLVTDPRQFYRVALRWAAADSLRSVAWDVTDGEGGALHVTARILDTYAGCRPFFFVVEGALTHAPGVVGLGPARVARVAIDDRAGTWTVFPPDSATIASSARRWLTALRGPQGVANEVVAQQDRLGALWAEMRRATSAFRNTLDALPALVLVVTAERILHANAAAEAFFGPALTAAASPLDLAVREDRPVAEALLGASSAASIRLLRGPEATWTEVRVIRGILWDDVSARVWFCRDLSDERDARASLQRTEATVRALFAVYPDVVLRLDRRARLLEVHGGREFPEAATLRTLVGQDLEEWIQAVPRLGLPILRDVITRLAAVFDSGRADEVSVQVPADDGSTRQLFLRLVPIAARDEALALVRDDTARADVERRLAIAERSAALGALAAEIAHEVNNPLTWVLTNVDLIREELDRPLHAAAIGGLLSEVIDGCTRIGATVKRMRALGESDRPVDVLVQLADVVRRGVEIARSEVRARARVEVELAAVPPILGEPTSLGEVVINLLVNAAQAMPERRAAESNRICVRLGRVGDAVTLTVEDNGLGIPADHLGRIFDPFFTTKAARSGTGLGLAVVHRVVEMHRGSVGVSSTPGEGTRFRLTFPLPAEQARAPAPPAEVASAPATRRRVLVIDDDPGVARALARALAAHDVRIAPDGETGLAYALAPDPPDAILCDLMMPGVSGMDVWERIGAERPELVARLAFLTGGAFTERANRFLLDSGARVLRKPVPVQALRALVAELLSLATNP